MYIWLFSRSVGVGSATTRKTRGLTRSVIALIVPPLPAVSRPSKTTQTFAPEAFTHSCIATSWPWRRRSSDSYSLRRIFGGGSESCVAAVSSAACDLASPFFFLCFLAMDLSLRSTGPVPLGALLGLDGHERLGDGAEEVLPVERAYQAVVREQIVEPAA